MKISYECGPCFLRQAREAMDLSCDDDLLKIEIMNDIFNFLADNFSKDTNSNKTGSMMHNIIKSKTGCEDPYFREKIQGNEIALKYLPIVKEILKENDSLENYVKIAIIGNILDFGAFTLDDDIDAIINDSLNDELAVKDIVEFENSLKKHDKVLYLVDNTGEIVFDKLLMAKIKEYAGTVGYVDSEISDEFRQIFDSHEFVISKGMGNYEGLTEIDLSDKDVYFLLCAKCNTIARDIGVNLKDMLLFKK